MSAHAGEARRNAWNGGAMIVLRRALACAPALLALLPAAAAAMPALIPAPATLRSLACGGVPLARAVRFPESTDPGGFDLVRERWTALGIAAPRRARTPDVRIVRAASGGAGAAARRQGYTLRVDGHGIAIASAGADGEFNALATLAQLPEGAAHGWRLPCVAIDDAPALTWRGLSDDISRGPFPTMRYFKERLRTLAGFKINLWSPYMEHVFFDPGNRFVAFPDALSAADLRELAVYARRYHIALVPEQQTFAHMHETLKYEQLAPLGDLPHGYLLSESDPATYVYLGNLVRAELAAARPPFFHVGADEPVDLGRGRTPRTAEVFAEHVKRVSAAVAAFGARPVIWDDAIQQNPSILGLLPKSTVIATFHYGAEPSFAKYIGTVASAGFEQFVAPGANNWNEIYPDLDTAYANAAQFLADGKAAHVLGMFDTVWHDDGESLFEATWSPVAFAAATAWQPAPVDRAAWHATFARAFFGTDDPAFAADLDALRDIRSMLRTKPASDSGDYLFWSDPFDARVQARAATLPLAAIRTLAERVMGHLAPALPPVPARAERPPLHAQAAAVMRLAALRYDDLGRRFEIGKEARDQYDDARAHAGAHADDLVYRGLNIAKYLCWELRDEITAIEPLYAQAWRYESRPAGLARVRVRYRLAAEQAVTDADRLNAAARESYLRAGVLPPFDDALGRTR